MKRLILQRPIVLAPLAISQHTAHVLGFKTSRAYLDWLVAANVPHAERGKDRIVAADVALSYLAPPKVAPKMVAEPTETADAETDRVLAAIGRKRRAG